MALPWGHEFVPPQAIQQLRDLTRTRKQLVRETSQHSLRIQKVLEDANLELGSVLSDVLGRSGRAMLDAIVAGERDPAKLAALAQGTARSKNAELREALRGRVTEHHRRLLRLHLQMVDALDRTLAELDAAVGKALAPIRQRARLLMTMPGVSDLTANVVLAEIGDEFSDRSCVGPLHLRSTDFSRAREPAARPCHSLAARQAGDPGVGSQSTQSLFNLKASSMRSN